MLSTCEPLALFNFQPEGLLAGRAFNAIFMGERKGENNRKNTAGEEKRKSAAGAVSLSSRQHKARISNVDSSQ